MPMKRYCQFHGEFWIACGDIEIGSDSPLVDGTGEIETDKLGKSERLEE